MKVLIFSVAYHPFVGGAEIAVKEFTDRLSDIEFHMVTVNIDGKQKKEERIGNVNVYRVGSGMLGKYLMPILGLRKALALHKVHNFSATWSVMASYNGFAALFFKYLRPKVPFILTIQEGDSVAHIMKHVWFIFPLFKQIFCRADKIQAISNFLADFARRMGGREPIEVIPNGVDVSLFTRDFLASELEDFKNKLGKGLGDVFLITTSRLTAKNGLDDVIRALKFLPDNFKFLILGTGELENKLRGLAKKLGLAGRVKFLGHIAHAEIPKYLKVSDIFIRPSLSEGMGNSFIEAMAANLPVVATPVGGIPDFIINDQTGFLVKVKNPEEIAGAVKNISEDGLRRTEVVKNAHELAIKNYDWDMLARQMRERVFGSVGQ